jgi:hypothetical protein
MSDSEEENPLDKQVIEPAKRKQRAADEQQEQEERAAHQQQQQQQQQQLSSEIKPKRRKRSKSAGAESDGRQEPSSDAAEQQPKKQKKQKQKRQQQQDTVPQEQQQAAVQQRQLHASGQASKLQSAAPFGVKFLAEDEDDPRNFEMQKLLRAPRYYDEVRATQLLLLLLPLWAQWGAVCTYTGPKVAAGLACTEQEHVGRGLFQMWTFQCMQCQYSAGTADLLITHMLLRFRMSSSAVNAELGCMCACRCSP